MKMAQALLLTGELARGWEHYEWRYQIPGAAPLMPPTDRPQWDGRALRGERLLLIGDQGYGDVLMFARYMPWARDPGRHDRAGLQPGDAADPAAHVPAAARPTPSGTACRPMPVSARSPACRGCTAPRWRPFPAPLPVRRRSGAGGAVESPAGPRHPARAAAGGHRLGRAADAQQRPQPLRAAGRFRAARRGGGRGPGVAAERAAGGAGAAMAGARAAARPRCRNRAASRTPRRSSTGSIW